MRQRDGVGSVGTGSGRPRRAARGWLSSFSAREGAIRASRSGGRAHPRRVKRARRRDRDARARGHRRVDSRRERGRSRARRSLCRPRRRRGPGREPPGGFDRVFFVPCCVCCAFRSPPRAIAHADADDFIGSPRSELATCRKCRLVRHSRFFFARGGRRARAALAPEPSHHPPRAPPARAPTVLGCVIAPGLGAHPTPRGRVLARARVSRPPPDRRARCTPPGRDSPRRARRPRSRPRRDRARRRRHRRRRRPGDRRRRLARSRRPLHAAPPRSAAASRPRPPARRPHSRPLARRAPLPRDLSAPRRDPSVRAADGDTLGAIAEYAAPPSRWSPPPSRARRVARTARAATGKRPHRAEDVPGVVPQTRAGVREADHRGRRRRSEHRGEEAEAHPRLARQARRRLRRERRSR